MGKPKLSVTPPDDENQPEGVDSQWEAAHEVKRRPITWLLPGRILSGSVAILEGEKGVGKSTFNCAIVANITTGKTLLRSKKKPTGHVLWLPGEEDAATVVKPRLEAAGADLKRVHFPGPNDRGERRRLVFPSSLTYLRNAVDHYAAQLVIIDPLSSHVPPDTDLRSDQAIHQVLDPLADLAHTTGCTILLTRNLTKDRTASRINQGLGGAAVGGVARSILVIDWPDRRTSRRVLRLVACNLSRGAAAVEYELADQKGWPTLANMKEIPMDNDDDGADLEEPGERDVRADAMVLLRRLLDKGWVSYADIEAEALGAGIGLRTLRKAKAELGVRSRRVGTSTPAHWEWGPPKAGW